MHNESKMNEGSKSITDYYPETKIYIKYFKEEKVAFDIIEL